MDWNWRHYAIAGFIVGLAMYNGSVFVERAKKGRRLTRTVLLPNGAAALPGASVPVAPEVLRAEAAKVLGRPVSMTAYALARMLGSEGVRDTASKRRVRAWVLYNDWQKLRTQHGPARWPTLESVLVFSQQKAENGFFGDQAGRRFATSLDPYEGDFIDAEQFLKDFASGRSPIGTATKFVDEKALGVQKGTQGKTLASLEKEWGGKFRHIEGDLYVMG